MPFKMGLTVASNAYRLLCVVEKTGAEGAYVGSARVVCRSPGAGGPEKVVLGKRAGAVGPAVECRPY